MLKAHRGRASVPATGREFVNTLKGLSGPTTPDQSDPAGDPAPPRPANAESVYSRL
ncbi:MAG TPA: hypothetical protein VMZ71_11335 [Gemmataceae bacterium]|nr:hypothetical protein [Gemmataceae bacterium]